MRVEYSRHFVKTFKKCSKKIQLAFRAKLVIFLSDQFTAKLNNHALTDKYFGYKQSLKLRRASKEENIFSSLLIPSNYRSINISGDWRAVFEQNNDEVYFVTLGTHSQLYG